MRSLRKLGRDLVNVVFYLMIAVLILTGIRQYILQPFQVDGHSMEATLHHGEHMLLFPSAKINRFDVVVFPDPKGSGNSYVKRVIGIPGDHLQVKNDQLYLNDLPVPEPYLEPNKSQADSHPFTQDFSLWDTLGIETIPEGYYFVMGDNRPGSGDSRQFGLVPIASVQGKADLVYWPFNQMRRMAQYQLQADGSLSICAP